ncbi:hypothetical protein CO704_11035 [Cedecea neteri]|uniref:OmpR/PhoB-type domain-containing protein n=2 Tax=Cedecea neteri TaxID=158822 RepID=A0A291DXP8_9ENTR|nr:hypothetical protein CO704_11035 [Cedecea neteri]
MNLNEIGFAGGYGMSEVILVNHQVKFEPNRNTLSSMSLPERKITLPSSSSRCLKVLLSKQGDVVTIKQFHKLVWEKNKTIVSDNTIYQNISIIRKALTAVGADKNIVETHTRRGWCVPESVHVSIEIKQGGLAQINDVVEENSEPRTLNSDVVTQDAANPDDVKHKSMLYPLCFLWAVLILVLVLYVYVL